MFKKFIDFLIGYRKYFMVFEIMQQEVMEKVTKEITKVGNMSVTVYGKLTTETISTIEQDLKNRYDADYCVITFYNRIDA